MKTYKHIIIEEKERGKPIELIKKIECTSDFKISGDSDIDWREVRKFFPNDSPRLVIYKMNIECD